MSITSNKPTIGMLSVGAAALMIITLFVIPGMERNADAIAQHEKLIAHPVALNEFDHVKKELANLSTDIEVIKETVIQNQLILCKIENC